MRLNPRSASLTALVAVVAIGGLAWAGTHIATLTADFDALLLPAGSSTNVSTSGDALSLTSVNDDFGTTPVNFYRGETVFGAAFFTAELAKDNGADFFTDSDECMLAADLDSLLTAGDVWLGGANVDHRIGPFEAALDEAAVGNGVDILDADWEVDTSRRIDGVYFLTTGTHDDDRDAVLEATYTVTFFQPIAGATAVVVDVPRDNLPIADGGLTTSSSGDAVCDVSDTWCVTPVALELGEATCGCDGASGVSIEEDKCHVLEVWVDGTVLANEEITSLDIAWTEFDGANNGLEGPFSATLEIPEATYDTMFLYDGSFTTDATVIDAGAQAIWFDLAWDQTLNGDDLRIDFDCDDDGLSYPNGSWNTDTAFFDSASDGANNGAIVDTALGVGPGDHCRGQYASYTVTLLDNIDDTSGPVVNSITLSYAVDVDGDGWGIGADLPAFQAGVADCDDGNAGITGNTTFYPDCDGDGEFDSGNTCDSCSAVAADGDCPSQCVSGLPLGGWSAVAGTDCDDEDGTGQALEDWYPDCDADGEFDNVATNACGEDGADFAFDCFGGGDPTGGWNTTLGVDCNDDDGDMSVGHVLDNGDVGDNKDNDCSSGGIGDECFDDSGDGDGDGDISGAFVQSPNASCADAGESTTATDCSPLDADISGTHVLDATDVNDLKDNDCTEGGVGLSGDECYDDSGDGDGDGDISAAIIQSANVSCADAGESTTATDCAPTDGDVSGTHTIDGTDIGDNKDNDCSSGGVGDECYDDSGDGDGDGDGGAPIVQSANASCADAGESTTNTDCSPLDADISGTHVLDATDVNDLKDNDCSEGGVGLSGDECYDDSGDGDGDGDDSGTIIQSTNVSCAQAGESTTNTDCSPLDADISGTHVLDATDVNDLKDNDCTQGGVGLSGDECYDDSGDGDGDGDISGTIIQSNNVSCAQLGESTTATDCSPLDGDISGTHVLNAGDVNDLKDNDCTEGGVGLNGDECYDDSGDTDGDGDISGAIIQSTNVSCAQSGESTTATDCSPLDADISGTHVLDGTDVNDLKDNDCSEGGVGLNGDECYDDSGDTDGDGDISGAIIQSTNVSCAQSGESTTATDCSPLDADISGIHVLDATDVNDLKDNDCTEGGVGLSGDECYDDSGDGDGDGDISGAIIQSINVSCANGGESTTATDCSPLDADISGTHVLDGTDVNDLKDNDCSEGGVGLSGDECYDDSGDGDGDGDISGAIIQSTNVSCAQLGEATSALDCSPTDPDISGTHTLVNNDVADGKDNDCSQGGVGLNGDECWTDVDNDESGLTNSFVNNTDGICAGNDSATSNDNLDCDDTDPTEFDGQVWYADCDNDLQFDSTNFVVACDIAEADALDPCGTGFTPAGGYSHTAGTDCDDGDNTEFNGQVWFADCDNDGEFDETLFVTACGRAGANVQNPCGDGSPPAGGYVHAADTDCDDFDPNNFQANGEVCDGQDNDCNGQDDVGGFNLSETDNDTDGRVECDGDCDDSDPANFGVAAAFPAPGAANVEICDGQDNDCNGLDDVLGFNGSETDNDTDGRVECDGDCNDGDGGIYGPAIAYPAPGAGAVEVCGDGIDSNCDGSGGPTDDDDGDGLDYLTEVGLGTSDCDADSDNDNLNDFDEAVVLGTNPLNADSDGDQLTDDFEVGGDVLNPINSDGVDNIDALDTDDDNDTILTLDEDWDNNGTPTDNNSDGDLLPDYLDNDDDDDTLPTATEIYLLNLDPLVENTDGDLLPDYRDADDDDDGIPTAIEANESFIDAALPGPLTDADNDGLTNHRDLDSDEDGWSDAYEHANAPFFGRDSDGDTFKDYLDLDSDDDSVADEVELGTELAPGNTDGDSLENRLDDDDDGDNVLTINEAYLPNTDPLSENTDGDADPDFLDDDDDGDNVLTIDEAYLPNTDPMNENTDGDALPDYLDDDDDGDSLLTMNEAYLPNTDPMLEDSDLDMLPDYRDADDDNDGVDTIDEAYGLNTDPTQQFTDADLIPDYLDTDDDNDGVLTVNEAYFPNTNPLFEHTDGDVFPDFLDPDDDGDNVLTIDEAYLPNTDPMNEDTDLDLIPDYRDNDDDGDLVLTIDEAYLPNTDPMSENTDGDALPDYLDTDDDDDLVLTMNEAYLPNTDPMNEDTDGNLTPDYLDTDDDGDNVLTIDETYFLNSDPMLEFTDGDALPDYLDDDDDGDNVLTIDEAYLPNSDPMLEFTDADFLPDYRDVDDDGDNVLTIDEAYLPNTDPMLEFTDGDLLPDYRDDDDDGDLVLTIDEAYLLNTDPMLEFTDADLLPDYRDDDDDGDLVLTMDEAYFGNLDPMNEFTDGDLLPDYLDDDDDGDLVLTIDEAYFFNNDPMNEFTDGDALPDYRDDDDDGDLVLTIDEAYFGNNDPMLEFTDGDLLPDYRDDDDDGDTLLTMNEVYPPNTDPMNEDSDLDLLPDYRDADDDNDGVDTIDEAYGGNNDPTQEFTDGDAIPDYLDPDDDNDGVLTVNEAYPPNTDPMNEDTDGDLVNDYLDTDDDGDNVLTINEAYLGNTDPMNEDTDGDLINDYLDDDDDGDNVLTRNEAYLPNTNPRLENTDTDGVPDYLDPDDDDDRVLTANEAYGGNTDPMQEDTDNDLVNDYLDTDDDGDNVLTADEAYLPNTDPMLEFTDADLDPDYLDTDDDGDNVLTRLEAYGGNTDPMLEHTDTDLIPDYLDDDDDDDNVLTIDEAYGGNSDPMNEDTDNDLVDDYLDTDDDGDNVLTVDEAYLPNTDPMLEFTDADGLPDYLDTDDDGDNVLTIDEAYLPNTDPMLEDIDFDALPDYRDDDDDGDNVLTANEAYGGNLDPMAEFTDLDALPDYRDVDDDGDLVDTIDEAYLPNTDPMLQHTDGDGVPDYLDTDDDEDNLLTASEAYGVNTDPMLEDTDNDGLANYIDTDDDNDTVPTEFELLANVDHLSVDDDNDGVPDGLEWHNWLRTDPGVDCLTADCDDIGGGTTGDAIDYLDPWDRDNDGLINPLDPDDDGDNIDTFEESAADNECLGNPADGIPDYLDFDSDGDGDLDVDEGRGDDDGDLEPNYLDCDDTGCEGDTDGDGIPNCQEFTLFGDVAAQNNPDQDGDGIIDGDEAGDPGCLDADDLTPCVPQDTDGDGIIDILDPDDDGDGFPTMDELGDCIDGTDLFADDDGDGVPDGLVYDGNNWALTCDDGTEITPQNTDADTGGFLPLTPDDVPDYLDDDDDGDGKLSLDEGDTDDDGDGEPNYLDMDDSDGPDADADGDGIPNGDEDDLGLDPFGDDTDGDGIPDDIEIGDDPNNPLDTDGDGIIDALDDDDDGDGIPTIDEGTGDTDGDGIPNYLDTDSDGDGIPDGDEFGQDADCDNVPDELDADLTDGPCSVDTGIEQDRKITNDGGCACDSGSGPSGAWLVLLAVALIGRRRR